MRETNNGAGRLPNLIIAGVVKGGTTSLFSYLSQHPQICPSNVKETCYFSAYRYHKPVEPFERYRGYFAQAGAQQYVMEATPGYFDGGKRVADEIARQVGTDTSIIIVLRNPVERLLSFFKYKKSMLELPQNMALEDYLDRCQAVPLSERIKQENDTYWGIDGGFYANHMEQWIDVFGNSLKVLFFDDLKTDPLRVLFIIADWLKIDAEPFNRINLEPENKSVNYKNQTAQRLALLINQKAEIFWRANPALKRGLRSLYYRLNGSQHRDRIEPAVRRRLDQLYAPYNQRLAQQLTRFGLAELPPWLADGAAQTPRSTPLSDAAAAIKS